MWPAMPGVALAVAAVAAVVAVAVAVVTHPLSQEYSLDLNP